MSPDNAFVVGLGAVICGVLLFDALGLGMVLIGAAMLGFWAACTRSNYRCLRGRGVSKKDAISLLRPW